MTDTPSHADDGYRALGQFLVVFSHMVMEMRWRIEMHIRRPTDPPMLAALVFAEATADQISSAFFGMCRLLTEHDKLEAAAVTKLRRAVREGDGVIPFRNRIAHGDWQIGYMSTTGLPGGGSTPPAPVAPTVIRIKALRTDGVIDIIEPNLDERSDEVRRLTKLLREYGAVCFGTHGLQLSGQHVRVGDVLVLDNDGKPVLGPKALPYSSSY